MSSTTSRKVAVVIGASRGIGRQIALDLAKNGYTGTVASHFDPSLQYEHTNPILVVVAAKSVTPEADLAKLSPFPPDPNSPQSTITTVAREITLAGGEATAIRVDTTDYASIQALIAKVIEACPFSLHSPSLLQFLGSLCPSPH